MDKGKLIVLSAPSGCGKTTVVRALMELRPSLRFSVSATTRAPREGEVDGRDYFFVTKEKFEEMIADDAFLEYARYVENYYGTPKRAVDERLAGGCDVLLDIETQGALQVMEKRPDALTVFLMPPSFEELRRRLVSRGKDSAEAIRGRLEAARHECSLADRYAHVIVNDDVERAAREFSDIIDKAME